MVAPSIGEIVLVRFPFSDLTNAKLRPAVVVAEVGRQDWVLCQITSNPYADDKAVMITDNDFSSGSLLSVSYARPGKLFSTNISIMDRVVGQLKRSKYVQIVEAVIAILRQGCNDKGNA